jgi:hypothetical protein
MITRKDRCSILAIQTIQVREIDDIRSTQQCPLQVRHPFGSWVSLPDALHADEERVTEHGYHEQDGYACVFAWRCACGTPCLQL